MKNISVIGAGTMGNGIAHVFAMNGYKTELIDISQDALDKAVATITKNLDRMVKKEKITEALKQQTLENLDTHTHMQQGVQNADVVIEAVSENFDLKTKIFSNLNEFTNKDCILASNTSSISITKIAAITDRPDKVIGMHFMNPVPVMKLVEIIRGYSTSNETMNTIVELTKAISKVPVEANDYPGFVSNRILVPMINEAIYALYEGVAGVEEIDQVMMLGMAHPMGPLHLADFVGLDIALSICNVLYEGFGNPKYAPCPLLVNMVAAGKLGIKSGEGFYKYTPGSKEKVVSPQFDK